MKVLINTKSKPNTIEETIHTSKEILTEMIKTTNQNVSNPVKITKEDNYKKTFNKSFSKTHKRKYYSD